MRLLNKISIKLTENNPINIFTAEISFCFLKSNGEGFCVTKVVHRLCTAHAFLSHLLSAHFRFRYVGALYVWVTRMRFVMADSLAQRNCTLRQRLKTYSV